jgi:uncharacterized surface protein with fasciclin (FAS1) repeats
VKKILLLLLALIATIGAMVGVYLYFNTHKSLNNNQANVTQSQAKLPISNDSLSALIANYSDLSIFHDGLVKTGLDNDLKSSRLYTVFAPTNLAFKNLPPGTLSNLEDSKNKDIFKLFLQYQIAKGSITTSMMNNGNRILMSNSQEGIQAVSDRNYSIIDAKGNTTLITKSDIRAKNGVLHIVNAVLLPQ